MRTTVCRLIAVAVLAVAASPVQGAPIPDKPADPMAAARLALDEVGDMSYQGRSLNDVIADVQQKSKIALTLDNNVFAFGIDPNQPIVNVNLKQVKLKDGLKAVLAPYNLRFGLVREGVFISTEEGLTIRQLRQRVTVDCEGTPFSSAAKQLAADTGANLVLDPRLTAEQSGRKVSLKLEDVPLETAVRLLAEVADLRVVRMSNVLFVTTPERAEKLRPDADGPTQPTQPSPFGIAVPPPAIGGPIPFGGAGGAVPIPAPVPAVEVPAKPPVKKD
ncbi:MAG TPA: hypothetical protein VKE74_03265 [Gemmataceae bacterium]|nr:hypothetical protein [Gemmataceae bacterium]